MGLKQKVAVSVASKQGLASMMDSRFGRTPAFLIVSGDDNNWTVSDVVDNDAAAAAHGAGGAAAALVAKYGVDSVISGRFGPKAYQALEALGIEMWIFNEGQSAKEALNAFNKGLLKQMKITVY